MKLFGEFFKTYNVNKIILHIKYVLGVFKKDIFCFENLKSKLFQNAKTCYAIVMDWVWNSQGHVSSVFEKM